MRPNMNNVEAQSIVPLSNEPRKLSEIVVQHNDFSAEENRDSSGDSDTTTSDDSNDDDGSESTSSTDSAGTEGTLEQAEITNEILQLPRDLCEYESVFREFFKEDLWSQLESAQRMRLQSKLPDFSKLLEPAEAMAEQQHTVQLLFANRLHRFGRNPLLELHRNLQSGNYRPDIKALRRSILKSQRREQRFRECERIGRLAKRMFIARERFLRKAYNAAPDETINIEKSLQRHKNQHSFLLNADTKICAVRARKRYYAEIAVIKKQLFENKSLPSDTVIALSADEEDKSENNGDDDNTTMMHLPDNFHQNEELNALKSAATFASSTDKCIYDTFFERRKNYTDEEAMRLSQYAKRPKLSNRNFKQYLVDYKRKKLTEPNLPEYETADIRLRDVCARAQIGGSFKRSFPLGQKPGRKPKPKTTEPPALVPIMQPTMVSPSPHIATYQKVNQNLARTQNTTAKQFEELNQYPHLNQQQQQQQHFDCGDGIELQQEEVETTTPPAVIALPKLEPIVTKKSPIKVTTNTNTIENANKAIDGGVHGGELVQETHSCFFALIRDLFCATPNHRMRLDELKQRISIWLNNPISALNDWYTLAGNWSALLHTAVKFLAGDYVEQPPDYVPYIEYKQQLNIYQWIGAGRDSNARLKLLCNFWLEHRKELHLANKTTQAAVGITSTTTATVSAVGVELNSLPTATSTATPPPAPRFPTNWTIRPATPDEIEDFRRQERERFEQPHRAYTYRQYGYESVVGPVKGIYAQSLSQITKARAHSMMIDDRPNFVTILTLVRDATARLPNGEGTRADISELLKCSQYINPHVAENVMQSIVSGALDRLHTEFDACVRYDAKRKIWIYLHRNRSMDEFERLHAKQQQQQQQQVQINNKFITTNKLTKLVTTAATPTTANVDSSTTPMPTSGLVLNVMRKMTPKIVTKTTTSATPMPALVPAVSGVVGAVTAATTTTPTTGIGGGVANKALQPNIQKSILPVPPLKYNIPATVQKSLLKSTVQQQTHTQRRFIDAKTGATILTSINTGVSAGAAHANPINTLSNKPQQTAYSLQGGRLISVTATSTAANANNTTNATFLTGTPTSSSATSNSVKATSLTATVAGKRVSLSKPIIINQINNSAKTQQQSQQQQQIGNQNKLKALNQIIKATTQTQQQQNPQEATQSFIIPFSGAANSNFQQQQNQQRSPQQQFMQLASNVKSIVVEQPQSSSETTAKTAPKNIIRFVQHVKQQQTQVGGSTNKFIGQRLIATSVSNVNSGSGSNTVTIRGGTTKLLTTPTSLSKTNITVRTAATSNPEIKPASTGGSSASGAVAVGSLPGTIIKMSPQAFTALQQKQQNFQNVAKTTQQQQQIQPQRQQRLVIGNTAIVSHGISSNSTLKNSQQLEPSPTATQTVAKIAVKGSSTKPELTATSTPTAVGNKIQMLNATSLTPQQQRILIQNLKQQQLQQQQANAIANKPMTVVVSQSAGVTRLLKTQAINTTPKLSSSVIENSITPATSAAGGKTITVGGKATSGQILTLNTSTTTEVGSTIITPTNPTRNIITIGSAGGSNNGVTGATQQHQQRLITVGNNKDNTIATIASAGNIGSGGVRVIRTVNNEAINTNSDSVPTTFNIANIQGKQVVFATKTTPTNVKQIANSTGVGNSVFFGGQSIKLQSSNTPANLLKAFSGGATVSSTPTTNVSGTSHPVSSMPPSQQSQQLQTVIMGNQILRVLPQNLVSAKAINKSETSATSPVQNRIITLNANNNVVVGGGTAVISGQQQVSTSVSATSSAPKTLVLNSGTQTLRFQSAISTSAPQDINQQTTTTLQKSTTSGNRVVLAMSGGGQILLPSGGTLNLKSLQNMKLVSLAQVQQQQQEKTKSNAASATTISKS